MWVVFRKALRPTGILWSIIMGLLLGSFGSAFIYFPTHR